MTTRIFPGELKDALASEWIRPGDSMQLRGGTYSGNFLSGISGNVDKVIVVSSYPNEIATIDGSLAIQGAWVTYRDLHFTFTGWYNRQSDQASTNPTDVPQGQQLDVYAEGVTLEDCVIFDMTEGPGLWDAATNVIMRRCIVYNVGWSGPAGNRGHGHLAYTQNQVGTKIIEDNIFLQSFSTGIKMYAESVPVRNFLVNRNIVVNSGILWTLGNNWDMNIWADSVAGCEGITLDENQTYTSNPNFDPIEIGHENPVSDVHLINNYFPEGLSIYPGSEIVEDTGNIYGVVGNRVWINPLGTKAHVAIYNEAGLNSVAVDVSVIANPGDLVKAWNVQAGIDSDIQELTVAGDGTIAVDMQAANRSVATPMAWTPPATTFPIFGAFQLVRQ